MLSAGISSPARVPAAADPPAARSLAIVSAGAAVRFSTLDVQSFWLDEGITVGRLLRTDLGGC